MGRGGGLFEARGKEKREKKEKEERKTEAKTIGQSAYGLIRVPQPLRVSCEDDRPRNLIEGSFPFCFSPQRFFPNRFCNRTFLGELILWEMTVGSLEKVYG